MAISFDISDTFFLRFRNIRLKTVNTAEVAPAVYNVLRSVNQARRRKSGVATADTSSIPTSVLTNKVFPDGSLQTVSTTHFAIPDPDLFSA